MFDLVLNTVLVNESYFPVHFAEKTQLIPFSFLIIRKGFFFSIKKLCKGCSYISTYDVIEKYFCSYISTYDVIEK